VIALGAVVPLAGWGGEKAASLPAVKARGVSFEMVRSPAGEFMMGSEKDSEKPRHDVRVGSFDLGATEVTSASSERSSRQRDTARTPNRKGRHGPAGGRPMTP
jgi:formylglycine-generating enzyme required for sulfatase activity